MSKTKKTETLCHPEGYRFEAQLGPGETASFGKEIQIREEWFHPTCDPKGIRKQKGHIVGVWKDNNRVGIRICVPGWSGP